MILRASVLMWPSQLCGLRPVEARIPPFLELERHRTVGSRTRSARAWPGQVSPATTNLDARVDRPIRASSWANHGFDGQAGGHSVEGGGGLGRLRRTPEPHSLCGA